MEEQNNINIMQNMKGKGEDEGKESLGQNGSGKAPADRQDNVSTVATVSEKIIPIVQVDEEVTKSTNLASLKESSQSNRRLSKDHLEILKTDSVVVAEAAENKPLAVGISKVTSSSDESMDGILTEAGEMEVEEKKSVKKRKKRTFEKHEIYLQREECFKVVAMRFPKCTDCHKHLAELKNGAEPTGENLCRFVSLRKLARRKDLQYPAGFLDPSSDIEQSDVDLWLSNKDSPPLQFDVEVCKLLVMELGDQFCELISQDREALVINTELENEGNAIIWKRPVDKVRELCDVCQTTVFNFHWTCERCGFMACTECLKSRMKGIKPNRNGSHERKREHDSFNWLYCVKVHKEEHTPETLCLTQIIPTDVLPQMDQILHSVRNKLGISQNCGCAEAQKYANGSLGSHKSIKMSTLVSFAPGKKSSFEDSSSKTPIKKAKLDYSSSSSSSESSSEDDDDSPLWYFKSEVKKSVEVEQVKQVEVEQNKESSVAKDSEMPLEPINNDLKHYVRNVRTSYYDKAHLPLKVFQRSETEMTFPTVSHKWLNSGTTLVLDESDNPLNHELFNLMWPRCQPVVAANVHKHLNKTLWSPAAFAEDYGKDTSDLINCMTGEVLSNQSLKMFWDGFTDVSKRIKDGKGDPMILKLKDWPPGDDFAHFDPPRFEDLMKALPLPDYTLRQGKLNLAALLPKIFLYPDLGPKLYVAMGNGKNMWIATTNLHLDVSDAVNIMLYVGQPENCNIEEHNKGVLNAIMDSDCCKKTKLRVKDGGELPGALWHIFRPCDADKIRDLLNKLSIEKGVPIEPNHDPIHDQNSYLDKKLLQRLREEYNVISFPILQFKGDAVFIPAGAPHQVRNLNNCIKIAEDFVSPENVGHCFRLTEEFRNLSDTHSNHEDKLQIKNIVYHAVKVALSGLLHCLESNSEKSTSVKK